ncbi:pleurocidin-like peptide WF3 [Poeciliopsis prolifica]|uniref:pleurocidin-like peptide WF3 n=1 Tax=Poeciliopsis prolifica TaxID=188132 RepID=UPI00241346CF|nr:pleurocidin-like peptide WF3 [Poeciliopsis prolifica]
MKLAVVFLALSMVVLMAEPGEGFLGDVLKQVAGRCVNGVLGNKKAMDQANLQVDQQKLDQLLDQLVQEQLDQQKLDQEQLDQQDEDQLQMQKRSFQQH